MPEDNAAAVKVVVDRVESLLARIGAPVKPIRELHNENDWAYVIKLHAIIEASVNQLLVSHFGDERLEDAFTAMEMGDEKKGKAAFLKALNLLTPSSRYFIKKLGNIRNKAAHKIQSLDFNLALYLSKLDLDERNALAGMMQSELPQVQMNRLLIDNPRQAFFAVFCVVLFRIEEHIVTLQKPIFSAPGHAEELEPLPPESKAKE